MDLRYFQDCPSCGAPIELTEADRLMQCPFCDVKNYMVTEGPLRFVLPDNIPDNVMAEEILYIPYLRFKGHIYSCQGREVEHKIVDTTHLGIKEGSRLPVSLGLRPQAMKIILANTDQIGGFAKLTEELASIFSKAAKLTTVLTDSKKGQLYHRSFIGETISFVYLPTYIKEGQLFDAVLNRKITDRISMSQLKKNSSPFRKRWQPKFISTICPHCAAVMSGVRDSLVLTCSNCESCWQEKKGKFIRVNWSAVPGENQTGRFLPFWKITCDVTGTSLQTFADFLRITNQPVVIREIHKNLPFSFWVPAFKIRPKYFLHIAKNLTLSQTRLPEGSKKIPNDLFPVTMPFSEAMEGLKTILSYSVMNKRKFLPQLKSIDIQSKISELVFLPFTYIGQDLIQDQSSVTISRVVLDYGRTM